MVIDFQERLFAAMPEPVREDARRRVRDLLFVAGELGLPVVVTEQYPRGLGPTLEDLKAPTTFEKSAFSAFDEPGFRALLVRRHLLVCGMEAHVCVALTTLDARAAGFDIAVVGDGCLSRREADHAAGLELCRQSGATIVPTETALFALVERAGTPLFKEVSRRVR